MNEKEFLEVDEASLPDVELSPEQKERAKNRINSYIARLKNSNPELNIDSTPSTLSEIENELGEKSEKVRHGVHGANVLKELVLKAVDEEVALSHNKILYSCFLLGFYQEAMVGYIPVFSETPYYYKIYVTKDKLIIYSFDWFFKILKKKSFSLNQIYKVGVAPQFFVSKELNRETLLLKLNKGVEIYDNYYFFINENSSDKNDIQDLCNMLTSLGVKEYSKVYFALAHKKDKIAFILYNIIFIIIGLLIVSSALHSN
ncbi:MAG: hypothetical protein ACRC2K_03865 [Clostridium sp.]